MLRRRREFLHPHIGPSKRPFFLARTEGVVPHASALIEALAFYGCDRPSSGKIHEASVSACAVTAFRFLRHHARRPALAKNNPGNPAPAIGPGTVVNVPNVKDTLSLAFVPTTKAVNARFGTLMFQYQVRSNRFRTARYRWQHPEK